MCCARLAENTGRKNYAKNHHLRTIAQLCRAICSQGRHVSTIGKKLLNGNIVSVCSHNMVNFGPLTAEICWRVWAPQQISTGFASWLRYCRDVAQRRSTKLCTVFGPLLHWYTIYALWGRGCCPLTEFCQLQYSLCIQVLRSPILSV